MHFARFRNTVGLSTPSLAAECSLDALSAPAVEQINGLPVLWRAHSGPQTRFLASTAFEVGYGGAAGGGKTDAIVYGALRQIHHPSYRALILRRTFPELQELMDRAQLVYPQVGGTWHGQEKRWTFPSGAKVEFGYASTYQDVLQYQTDEFTTISFDQLDQLPEERIWTYLSSRVRAKAGGLHLGMRASFNPGGVGGQWIKRRFVDVCPLDGSSITIESQTVDGRTVNQTRAFIRAKISDNPALLRNDPTYADRLAMLSELEYKQLALGDWDAMGGAFYPEITTQAQQDRLFITKAQLPALLDWHEYWGSYDWGFVHPATFGQYVRIGNQVICLDTLFMHRYQDEEQAAQIKGAADRRCLRTVYAGHDAFAKRMAHSAAAETVADVFGRYSIRLERAMIDRAAGAQVVRRLLAQPPIGPTPKGSIELRFVDTPGNRRVMNELASLIPEETHPNVPAKRDANEQGLYGDDGADGFRYAIASPSFDPVEPPKQWKHGNVETGVDTDFEELTQPFSITSEGVVDRRVYAHRPANPEADFPGYDGEGENVF